MPETSFLLVRHGETAWNVQHLIQGHSGDVGLTARGVAQVRAAAERLTDSGARRIVSSDLARARESAEVIAELLGLPVTLDAGLRERSYGELEGRPDDVLTPETSGIANGMIVDVEAAPANGESLAALKERVTTTLERLAAQHPGETIIVVTHGGLIRTLRAAQSPSMLGCEWSRVANAEIWATSIRTD
ncbi:MAG: histidine phosphatase family protein [Acidobacteriota bacterium]|nr:histidine phosphatase family protein [Acidobacteriota bacterium]